jgi:hypothetical protein
MTGIELKIAEVLSEVFDDAPDEQLLFAAGELVRHSGELWIDVRQRPPMIGDRVLGLGARGIVHCGTVFSDPRRDGRIALRSEGHMVFVRDWMPCPERKGERE